MGALMENEVGAGFEVLRTADSSNSGTYRDHARGLAEKDLWPLYRIRTRELAGPLTCPVTAVELLDPLRLVSRLPAPSTSWRANVISLASRWTLTPSSSCWFG